MYALNLGFVDKRQNLRQSKWRISVQCEGWDRNESCCEECNTKRLFVSKLALEEMEKIYFHWEFITTGIPCLCNEVQTSVFIDTSKVYFNLKQCQGSGAYR